MPRPLLLVPLLWTLPLAAQPADEALTADLVPPEVLVGAFPDTLAGWTLAEARGMLDEQGPEAEPVLVSLGQARYERPGGRLSVQVADVAHRPEAVRAELDAMIEDAGGVRTDVQGYEAYVRPDSLAYVVFVEGGFVVLAEARTDTAPPAVRAALAAFDYPRLYVLERETLSVGEVEPEVTAEEVPPQEEIGAEPEPTHYRVRMPRRGVAVEVAPPMGWHVGDLHEVTSGLVPALVVSRRPFAAERLLEEDFVPDVRANAIVFLSLLAPAEDEAPEALLSREGFLDGALPPLADVAVVAGPEAVTVRDSPAVTFSAAGTSPAGQPVRYRAVYFVAGGWTVLAAATFAPERADAVLPILEDVVERLRVDPLE